MKDADSLRWSCKIVRGSAALIGKGILPRPLVSRHLARCAGCRRYFSAVEALEISLKNEARIHVQTPVPDLDQRIMRAVERQKSTPRRFPTGGWLAFGAAVAACIVTFGAIRLLERPGSEGTGTRVVNMQPHETRHPISPVAAAPGRVDPQLQRSVASLLAENPLQHEVNSVYADARFAVNFLALNFLPSATATPQRSRSGAATGPMNL